MPKVNCAVITSSFPLSSFGFLARRTCVVVVFVGCFFSLWARANAQTSPTPAKNAPAATRPVAPVQVELPPPPPMRYVPGLEEPLVATGPVSDPETTDLNAALAAYHSAPDKAGASGDFDDYAKPLLAFIDAHPQSNWNAALYLDVALGYYHSGYFSRTFGYLENAWQLGRDAKSIQAKRLIDRAAAELADMHARLGHAKELEALFADIGDRAITGSAEQKMEGAKDGLRLFRNHPDISYLCGPMALRAVLMSLKASPAQIKVAEDARSGSHGFSLTEVAALADKAGLKFKLVRREPGQPIPVPSIINWNVHHYAAITGTHDGVYHLQDATFGVMGSEITAKAIDEESSGYFLVPVNAMESSDRTGWQILAADAAEVKAVYGMGNTFNRPPGDVTPYDPGTDSQCHTKPPDTNDLLGDYQQNTCSGSNGMAVANARLAAVSLNVTDTPVGYRPQKGLPTHDTLRYNARDGDQPQIFSFSNVGPLWSHSWQGYIQDDPNHPGSSVTRIVGGGGGYDYSLLMALGTASYNSSTGQFTPETYDNSVLVRNPPTGPATSYVRNLPDGSVETYALSNGANAFPRYMFLTSVTDPQGNSTTLNYDSSFRLTSVTDAMDRSLKYTYGSASNMLLITQITDPFGRFAQLNYNPTTLQLISITDPIGITSSFTYGSVSDMDFITQLVTPYGTSKFSDTLNPNDPGTGSIIDLSLAMTDPLGYVQFVYLYQDQAVTGTGPEKYTPAGMSNDNPYLMWRNTYFWDKHAAANGGVTTDANGNPIGEKWTNPVIYHWFHQCCTINYISNQLGSVRMPLEQYREWVNYPNQPAEYYSGSLLRATAIGRVTTSAGTQKQLTQATYNPNGFPLTSIDPKGRETQYTYAANNIDLLTVAQKTSKTAFTTIATFGSYNSQHEPQTYKGADGQTWQYTYNAAGQLSTVTDPAGDITTYNYDTLGRLSTITNANQQTALTLSYDNADRIATRTDSQGYQLSYQYDNLDRITQITYPDGTTDLYDYTFQSGSNQGNPSMELRKHTDRLGRVTTYGYDADQRLTSVTEPSRGTTQYTYYENGTLKDIIDANGNDTHWTIDIQSRPTSKTYAYGTSSAQTERYSYETTLSRLYTVTDALGQVKVLNYDTDNRLDAISYSKSVNPTPKVAFKYDSYFPRLDWMIDGTGKTNYFYAPIGSLGGLKLSQIAGPFKNDTIGLTYDNVGRLSGRNIPGGNETFSYDAISRLSSHGSPLGSFTYGYLGQTDQTTSRSVTNGAVTVSTSWGYDTNTNDRRLISILNSGITRSYALGYVNNGVTNPYDIQSIMDNAAPGHPWQSQSHAYGYDTGDRLTSATSTIPGNFSYMYDNLDNATQVTSPTGTVNPTYNGLNQIASWNGNSYDYDADGNLLSGDGQRTYKWDAENRLIEVDYVGSTAKSQLSYDGLGHRTVDVETSAGGTITTARYIWCGERVCQTRDGSDNVLKRDLNEGEFNVSTGQKLVYMLDQLSSVRDVLDATTGALSESMDFGPYGNIARSMGSTSTGYEYSDLFSHSNSGLNLAVFRAQDATTGRWISRDPIRESGGLNIYSYAAANPTMRKDIAGLDIRIYNLGGHWAFAVDTSAGIDTFGFGPSVQGLPFWPGEIDEGNNELYSKIFGLRGNLESTTALSKICGDMLAKALRQWAVNPPAYNVITFNCLSFAYFVAGLSAELASQGKGVTLQSLQEGYDAYGSPIYYFPNDRNDPPTD